MEWVVVSCVFFPGIGIFNLNCQIYVCRVVHSIFSLFLVPLFLMLIICISSLYPFLSLVRGLSNLLSFSKNKLYCFSVYNFIYFYSYLYYLLCFACFELFWSPFSRFLNLDYCIGTFLFWYKIFHFSAIWVMSQDFWCVMLSFSFSSMHFKKISWNFLSSPWIIKKCIV